jgi:hypothetical protein
MPEATLDQRMTAMENAVREQQELIKARKASADWLNRVIGSMKDEPAFDGVLALGRAIRQADRPADDQLIASSAACCAQKQRSSHIPPAGSGSFASTSLDCARANQSWGVPGAGLGGSMV